MGRAGSELSYDAHPGQSVVVAAPLEAQDTQTFRFKRLIQMKDSRHYLRQTDENCHA